MQDNVKSLGQSFPEGKVLEVGDKSKVHLKKLDNCDIEKLYHLSKKNPDTGEYTTKVEVKRSGTGLTVIVG